jgi:MinD superfamily P-loop ATPase
LIVTEPTLSAIHDLERILDVSQHFQIPAVVCVNKYDINLDNTEKIENYCKCNSIDIVGKLPYDTVVTEAMVYGKNVIEYSSGDFSDKIVDMWSNIVGRL